MTAYRDLIPIEKCARCGYDELKCSLHVHHIDEDRTNNDTSNLVVLCANCHMGLHNNLWSLADIGITVTERKITPAYISDMKYEIETLKYKISKSNQLNTELKEENTSLKDTLENKCSVCNLAKRGSRHSNKMIAFMSYYSSDMDFIDFFFNRVPDDLFEYVHEEYSEYTRIFVKSIVSVYEELGYTNWRWLHPDRIGRLIEGRMCSISCKEGIRKEWMKPRVAEEHYNTHSVGDPLDDILRSDV